MRNEVSKNFIYDDKGNFHGEQKIFGEDGTLRSLATYDHGNLHGKMLLWDDNKTLIKEATYIDGLLEGTFFQRSADGFELSYTYKNSLREGPHFIFFRPNKEWILY